MTPAPASTMPPPIADVFRPLWQVVQNIHFNWRLYRQLFGTSPQRVELLNRVAGLVFGTYQHVLGHDITLSIFRLLDPATQRGGRDENLTLDRLRAVVAADCAPLGDELDGLLTKLRADMDPFADLRNKVLAHNDLRTTPALYDGTSTVPVPSREVVETVLKRLREFMDAVQSHYGEGLSYYYDTTMHDHGDGETLIRRLIDLEAQIDPIR